MYIYCMPLKADGTLDRTGKETHSSNVLYIATVDRISFSYI